MVFKNCRNENKLQMLQKNSTFCKIFVHCCLVVVFGKYSTKRGKRQRQADIKSRPNLGSCGDVWRELRGGSGGAGGRFSRRGILGDTHGEPLFGDCRRAWSDEHRTEDAKEARLLLASHCDGSCVHSVNVYVILGQLVRAKVHNNNESIEWKWLFV